MEDEIRSVLGKKITGVIVMQREIENPSSHVFFLFDNNQYYELWANGAEIKGASGINPGGKEEIIGHKRQGTKTIFEAHQNEDTSKIFGNEFATKQFKLTEEDLYAVDIAIKTARHFLTIPQITAQQIIGLGNALYALERLPRTTSGTFTEFGVHYRAGTEEFSEFRYIDFHISESDFRISTGGSVYDRAIGSDSIPSDRWVVEIDGYREEGCELWNLENDIAEYLNLGGKVNVVDDSTIDYEWPEE